MFALAECTTPPGTPSQGFILYVQGGQLWGIGTAGVPSLVLSIVAHGDVAAQSASNTSVATYTTPVAHDSD